MKVRRFSSVERPIKKHRGGESGRLKPKLTVVMLWTMRLRVVSLEALYLDTENEFRGTSSYGISIQ